MTATRVLPGLAALVLLAGCTGIPEGIEPVRGFEVERYLGTWYEIRRLDHRFERGLSHVTAHYAPREDGTIAVTNRGLDRATCRIEEATGRARFLGDPEVASLAVTFFPPFSGGYHVFALDREAYGWALVSGPTRDYLWLLARAPSLAAEDEAKALAIARDAGFDVDALLRVDHGAQACDMNGGSGPPTPDG